MSQETNKLTPQLHVFEGNIYIFYAFDVGDEINLAAVEKLEPIFTRPLNIAKYFKNYHLPLSIELPHPHSSGKCISVNLHTFGVISLMYKIPFEDTLENLKNELLEIDHDYQEQSVEDAQAVFKVIKKYVKQPNFFNLRTSYVVIQVDQQPNTLDVSQLKEKFGGVIASLLRFEKESLSEYQKNDILEGAHGYYRGDLSVIDTEAAFIYDEEYEELLPLFEFVNIQQLQLQYFDRVLDNQLYSAYQQEVRKTPLKTYLPIIGTAMKDPVSQLAMLKVDISAIIERLESSIKLAGETYISETYSMLNTKLELDSWRASINSKLSIIEDIHMIYRHKTDAVREDILTVLIIILITIEVVVALMGQR
ncbi:MAG: hypothetical protein AB7F19_00530 [Candidatus Babeliales bacterium]